MAHFQETGGEPMSDLLDPNDLLTPSDAARVLGLSADSVRVLSDSGRLASMRTIGGRRLFRRGDVDRLVAERASQLGAARPSSQRRRTAISPASEALAPSMK
jgi:excisionase family DNA binding protein